VGFCRQFDGYCLYSLSLLGLGCFPDVMKVVLDPRYLYSFDEEFVSVQSYVEYCARTWHSISILPSFLFWYNILSTYTI